MHGVREAQGPTPEVVPSMRDVCAVFRGKPAGAQAVTPSATDIRGGSNRFREWRDQLHRSQGAVQKENAGHLDIRNYEDFQDDNCGALPQTEGPAF